MTANSTRTPLPYVGSHGHPRRSTLTRYASDRSGAKTYSFNSLGYRGPEPSISPKARILACGCSYTFGEGLNYEETWPYFFARWYADYRHLDLVDVDLHNLSQAGASNDYIARTTLPQLDRVRPDLAVILFTRRNRAEAFQCTQGAATIESLGPWVEDSAALAPVRLRPGDERRRAGLVELAESYYAFYEDDWGLVNALKNMLLLQLACGASGTEYIFCWVEHPILGDLENHPNHTVRVYREALDLTRFCWQAPTDDALVKDLAADGLHPGPISNRLFAEHLFDFWKARPVSSLPHRPFKVGSGA